jgi:ketosteroid isomerase-like protein
VEEHPNAETVRKALMALRSADAATITSIFADDAELVVSGRSPIAAVYDSAEAIAEFAQRRLALSEGTFRTAIHDVVAKEGHAFAVERHMATRNGRSLEMRTVTLLHVFDGCVEGGIILSSDTYAADEFWS